MKEPESAWKQSKIFLVRIRALWIKTLLLK
jgi:hypothetical protein